MSERYTRLFSLPNDLYAAGAPILIAAGAISKDNQKGDVFAQLKLCNLQEKPIKAVKIFVSPFDTVGQPLGEGFTHQYLDLNAVRDAHFAQQTPIPFPDAATRSFSVSVTEVIFTDNSVWNSTDTAPWQPLPAAEPLDTALGEREMVKQYRIRYGNDCRFLFKRVHDVWRCPCGAWNKDSESVCHTCKKQASSLDAFDTDALRAECDARLTQEREKAAEQKAAVEAQTKKLLHIAKFAVPIAIVLLIAIGLGTRYMAIQAEHREAYDRAAVELATGDYLDALYSFEDLGGFKDSPEQAKEALYNLAIKTAESGRSSGRISKEARNKKKKNSGNAPSQAAAAADDGSAAPSAKKKTPYDEAIEFFEELGDYRDSAELKAEVERQVNALEELETIFEEVSGLNSLREVDLAKAAELVGNTTPAILIDDYRDYDKAVTEYLPYFGTFEFISGDDTVITELTNGSLSTNNRYVLRQYRMSSESGYFLTVTPATSEQAGFLLSTEFPEADFSMRISGSSRYNYNRIRLSTTERGTVLVGKYTRYGNSPLSQCELKKVSNDTKITAPAEDNINTSTKDTAT